MTEAVNWAGKHVHLMGVAGAGMRALVPLLIHEGARVSGCDLASCDHMFADDVDCYLGHDVSHVQDVDMLVYSTAVPGQHEELREARLRGLPVMTRASCLAELMRGHDTIAVAGSHGKTTTTWMLAHILTCADHDPIVMCGGSVDALAGGGGKAGSGRLFVAEVDESDGGFLHVDPHIAIITNLEAEHIRHYGSYEALIQAMHEWLQAMQSSEAVTTTTTTTATVTSTNPGAIIIAKGDCDPHIYADVSTPIITCSVDDAICDYTCRELNLLAEGSDCTIIERGQEIGRIHIPMPGRHNVINALLAIAAARCVDEDCNIATLNSCERVDRRFSVRGTVRGIRVVEDYAHHPTEISVTIAAAQIAGAQVHVIFQPHRYSRTVDSFNDFVHCFDHAHALTLLPIYAAHEEPIPGVHSRALSESIAAHQRQQRGHGDLVQYAAHADEAVSFVCAHAHDGDTILVLGAGDIHKIVPEVLAALAC